MFEIDPREEFLPTIAVSLPVDLQPVCNLKLARTLSLSLMFLFDIIRQNSVFLPFFSHLKGKNMLTTPYLKLYIYSSE